MNPSSGQPLPQHPGPSAAVNRRVSMADVARLAGVSSQTVSRVTNGSPGVIEATRAQVIAAMNQLGYRPNSAARALKRGSFRTIGVGRAVSHPLTAAASTNVNSAIRPLSITAFSLLPEKRENVVQT